MNIDYKQQQQNDKMVQAHQYKHVKIVREATRQRKVGRIKSIEICMCSFCVCRVIASIRFVCECTCVYNCLRMHIPKNSFIVLPSNLSSPPQKPKIPILFHEPD